METQNKNQAPQITKKAKPKKGSTEFQSNYGIPKELTSEHVQQLSSIGCTKLEVARLLKVPIETLDNYDEAYLQGLASLKYRLRIAQIESALSGNVQMQIWLGKNLLGQVDKPVELESNIDELFFEQISTQESET